MLTCVTCVLLSPMCPLFGGCTVYRPVSHVCYCPQCVLYLEVALYADLCHMCAIVPNVSFIWRLHCILTCVTCVLLSPMCPLFGGCTVY